MSEPKKLPNRKTLESILFYCPDTGILFWKPRPVTGRTMASWNTRYAFKPAGCPHAYRNNAVVVTITVDGKKAPFYAHRIVWAMHGKDFIDGMVIDHKDRNPLNNRIENLRLATHSQNVVNSKGHGTLLKGVVKDRHKFAAHFVHGDQFCFLGSFDSEEAAHQAYQKKSIETHGEFSPYYEAA